jgi:uncharacterized secreted protein with C-terminal beta-propeller domain
LAGRDKPQAAAATVAPIIGYDVEFERQLLAFETRNFEAELALPREENEAARLKDELQERRRQEEIEAAREKELAIYQLHEQDLRMKQQQWEWEKMRHKHEAEKQKTPVAQVKFFRNVLKNVMPEFPNDTADLPICFEGIEKL